MVLDLVRDQMDRRSSHAANRNGTPLSKKRKLGAEEVTPRSSKEDFPLKGSERREKEERRSISRDYVPSSDYEEEELVESK